MINPFFSKSFSCCPVIAMDMALHLNQLQWAAAAALTLSSSIPNSAIKKLIAISCLILIQL